MTLWTLAHEAPLSMEFSRQEHCSGWSGLLFPSPGDLLDPGTEPRALTLQAPSLLTGPAGKTCNSLNGENFEKEQIHMYV